MTAAGGLSSRRKLLLLAVVLLALLSAVGAAMAPTERNASIVDWTSKDAAATAVTLMNPTPARIEATGPISTSSGPSELLRTFSGARDMRIDVRPAYLTLVQEGGSLRLLLDSPEAGLIAATDPIPATGTEWSLEYADGTAVLSTPSQTAELTVPENRLLVLNWLSTDDATGQTRAQVTTSGLSLDRPAAIHGWLILASLLLLLLAVGLSGELRGLSPVRAIRGLRLTKVDAFVIAGVVLNAIVAVPHYDDGWYLARSRLLAATGWSLQTPLTDPFWGGVPNVQGFLYESVLGETVGRSSLILVIRLVPVALALLTWFVLSRRVLPRLLGEVGSGLLLAAAAFLVVWSLGWMTLRPEVLVACLSVLLLAAFPRPRGGRVFVTMLTVSGLAGLGLATHQSALVLVPMAGIAILVLLFTGAASWTVRLAGLLAGVAVSLALAFMNQNARLAAEGLLAYDRLTGHGHGPLDEWMRVSEILRLGSMSQRLYFLVGMVGLAVLLLVTAQRLLYPRGEAARDLMFLALSVMPAGLLFTSSKWGWHYGALLLPYLVGILLLIRFVSGAPRAWLVRAAAVLGLPLLLAVAARTTALDGSLAAPIAVITLVACAVAMLAPPRSRPLDLRIGLSLALSATLVVGLVLWHDVAFQRASKTGWSFLAQTVGGLVDSMLRCGVPSFIPAIAGPDGSTADGSTAMDQIAAGNGTAAVTPGQYLFSPCVDVWTHDGGLWEPIRYSIDLPTWNLANIPTVQDPPSACITQPDTGQEALYPTCLFELLPDGTPQETPAR